jgi:hypothetical protein
MRSSPTAIALKAMAPDGTGPRLWSCCGSRPGGALPAGGISLTGVRPLVARESALLSIRARVQEFTTDARYSQSDSRQP